MRSLLFFSVLLTCNALGCINRHPYLSPDRDYNQAVLERTYAQVISTGWDPAVIDSVFDRRIVWHFPNGEEQVKREDQGGMNDVKSYVEMMHTAFPDLKAVPDDIYSDSDRVIARYTLTGTQKGPYKNFAPTNKSFKIQGYDIVRVNSQWKIFERWGMIDELSLMEQLGLLSSDSLHRPQ